MGFGTWILGEVVQYALEFADWVEIGTAHACMLLSMYVRFLN